MYVDPNYWLITRNNTVTHSPDQVLPVNLQQFDVSKLGCTADIRFITDVEINLQSFDIQYSDDGGSHYQTIKTLTAAGNQSSLMHTYQAYFLMQKGVQYLFRLRINHLDGSSTFSNSRSIKGCINAFDDLSLQPNPAKDFITLNRLTEGVNAFRLLGSNGQLIRSFTSSNSTVTVPVGNLPKGAYSIQVKSVYGDTRAFKFIKE